MASGSLDGKVHDGWVLLHKEIVFSEPLEKERKREGSEEERERGEGETDLDAEDEVGWEFC